MDRVDLLLEPVAVETVPSHFLCYSEAALSLICFLTLQVPKGMNDSESLVLKMIQVDASNVFEHLIPEGANFVEIAMSPSRFQAKKKAYEPHPNMNEIPPMQIVRRGFVNHVSAIMNGDVVFVEEELKFLCT